MFSKELNLNILFFLACIPLNLLYSLQLPYNVTDPYPRSVLNQEIRIITQSCNYQHFNNNRLWAYMVVTQPDVVTLLGDTIYLDAQPCNDEKENCETMWDVACDFSDCDRATDLTCFNYCWSSVNWFENPWEQYKVLLNDSQFTLNKFYDNYDNWPVPIVAIWDDHDYCSDNSQTNCTWKNSTRNAYVDFIQEIDTYGSFTEDLNYLTQHNESGIYYYYDYNKTIIMNNNQSATLKIRFYNFDVRWYRTKNDMLGFEQREWFENLLKTTNMNDISYHIICTGSVYYPTFGIGSSFAEPWPTYDKEWFVNLTSLYNIRDRLIILSGDVHYSGIYRDKNDNVFEIVTSAMTHGISDVQATYLETIQDRLVGDIITDENIGILDLKFDSFEVTFIGNNGKIVGNFSYNYSSDEILFDAGNYFQINWFIILGLICFIFFN